MRNLKLLIAVLFLFTVAKAGSAAVPEYAESINAYQSQYGMQFCVWKPIGLQSKWYATYDGYPVTEIAKNQWVYGVIGPAGQLTESVIAVGSVDPNTIHILSPLPSFPKEISLDEENETGVTDSLKDIFKTECNAFGIAYTNASLTPIAWESDTLKVYMWGGSKWVLIPKRHGERMADTIKRNSNIVADMLREDKVMWTQMDTYEFANYVRIAGYIWIGDFEPNMPLAFTEVDSGRDGDHAVTGTGGVGRPGGGWDTGLK